MALSARHLSLIGGVSSADTTFASEILPPYVACCVLMVLLKPFDLTGANVHHADIHFSHSAMNTQVTLNQSTMENVLTVGNGELGFTVDLTGLQSLNTSYKLPGFPLFTQSNWGWHSPDPAVYGVPQLFNTDGTLNYRYENVTVSSLDPRRPGNRSVPYQFDCANYNDPALCNYLYMFPARTNLGQLSFVLPKPKAPPTPAPTPMECTGLGNWCNSGDTSCRHSKRSFGHGVISVIKAASPVPGPMGCNEIANCTWGSGWHNAPFCVAPNGTIAMRGVTLGKVNMGYFDGSCDRIQWDNEFDRSAWCRQGAAFCDTPSPTRAAGPFKSLELDGVVSSDQHLDLYTGAVSSSFSYADPQASDPTPFTADVTTVVDSDSDTVAVTYTAPVSSGLSVQLAFCNLERSGGSCDWTPYTGDGNGPPTNMSTTVLRSEIQPDGRGGRLDLFRELAFDSYSVSCEYRLVSGPGSIEMQATASNAFSISFGDGPVYGDDLNRTVEVSCAFELNCCVGTTPPQDKMTLAGKPVVAVSDALANAAAMYSAFWEDGAFVDIAGSTDDPDAFELERRTILSLYLMRAQESGSVPPQESALLYNSWTGKHHSEMRYWHQV